MADEKRPAHFWEKEAKQLKEQIKEVKDDGKGQKRKASTVARVPIGIEGFDQLVEGGLKKNSITLVEGEAGTGKTIFCTQFLMEGILKYNEPGVFINFEEGRDEFFDNMLRFGWDMENMEREGKLAFMKTTPEQLEKMLNAGGGLLRDVLDRVKAKRVVIDSLSSYMMMHDEESTKRDSCLVLFQSVKKWECTTLVAGEIFENNDEHPINVLDYEVDGVIRLYNVKEQKVRNRMLEVYKMRGTKNAAKTFSFAITDNGIVVYPE